MLEENTTKPAPLPEPFDWIQFKRLPKWGWEPITLTACVLGCNSDKSRVQVGYIVGGEKFNHFIDRAQITHVYSRTAEAVVTKQASA